MDTDDTQCVILMIHIHCFSSCASKQSPHGNILSHSPKNARPLKGPETLASRGQLNAEAEPSASCPPPPSQQKSQRLLWIEGGCPTAPPLRFRVRDWAGGAKVESRCRHDLIPNGHHSMLCIMRACMGPRDQVRAVLHICVITLPNTTIDYDIICNTGIDSPGSYDPPPILNSYSSHPLLILPPLILILISFLAPTPSS